VISVVSGNRNFVKILFICLFEFRCMHNSQKSCNFSKLKIKIGKKLHLNKSSLFVYTFYIIQ